MRLLDGHNFAAAGLLQRGHGLTVNGGLRVSITGLFSNPTHGLSGQIGDLLTGVLSGLVGGETIVHRWTLDDVVISGATGQTYRPIVADELGVVRYVPLVDGVEVRSAGYVARRVPPVAGTLSAVDEIIGSGDITVNLAAGFAGNGLRYTSDQTWATVPLTGNILTIGTDVARDDTVTITATNSGGSATVPLSVTISQRPAQTIHVATTGNDTTGDGTLASPFATVDAALTGVIPGDTIVLRPGIYPPFRLEKSGSDGARIIITTLPGEERQAIIEGDLAQHVVNGGSGVAQIEATRDGIYVVAQDHFEIRNLTIRNVWRAGIFVVGEPGAQHGNFRIAGNAVLNTGSSGISVQGMNSANILPLVETSNLPQRIQNGIIEYNDVSATNLVTDYNNNSSNPQGVPGGVAECITVSTGCSNIITRFNDVHDSRQYGIDYKAGVIGGAIYGNRIWNMERYGIYVDTGRRFVEDVAIYNNEIWDCRIGIVLAREAGSNTIDYQTFRSQVGAAEFVQSLAGIDCYNNAIWDIEETGIFWQRHPQKDGPDGRIEDIDFRFNTVHNANRNVTARDLNLSGWLDADMIAAGVTGDLSFIGNIVANSTAAPIVLNTMTGNAAYTDQGNYIGQTAGFVDASATPPNLQLVSGADAGNIVTLTGAANAPFNLDINGATRALGPAGADAVLAAGAVTLAVTSETGGVFSASWPNTLTSITVTGSSVHNGTYTAYADGNPLAYTRLPNFAGRALDITATTGTAGVGEVLTAGEVLALYADGQAQPDVSYQWQRDGVDISGAISKTYTTVAADAGADVRPTYPLTATGETTVIEVGNAISIPAAVGFTESGVVLNGNQFITGQTLPTGQGSFLAMISVSGVPDDRIAGFSWDGIDGRFYADFNAADSSGGPNIDAEGTAAGAAITGSFPNGVLPTERYHSVFEMWIDPTSEELTYDVHTFKTTGGSPGWASLGVAPDAGSGAAGAKLFLSGHDLTLFARGDSTGAHRFQGTTFRVALWTRAANGRMLDFTNNPSLLDSFATASGLADPTLAQTLLANAGATRHVDAYGTAADFNNSPNIIHDGTMTLTATGTFS